MSASNSVAGVPSSSATTPASTTSAPTKEGDYNLRRRASTQSGSTSKSSGKGKGKSKAADSDGDDDYDGAEERRKEVVGCAETAASKPRRRRHRDRSPSPSSSSESPSHEATPLLQASSNSKLKGRGPKDAAVATMEPASRGPTHNPGSAATASASAAASSSPSETLCVGTTATGGSSNGTYGSGGSGREQSFSFITIDRREDLLTAGSQIQLGLLAGSLSDINTAENLTPSDGSKSGEKTDSPGANVCGLWQVYLRPIVTPIASPNSVTAASGSSGGSNSQIQLLPISGGAPAVSDVSLRSAGGSEVGDGATAIETDDTLEVIGKVAGLPTTTVKSGTMFDLLCCCSKAMYTEAEMCSAGATSGPENETITLKFSMSESWTFCLGFYMAGDSVKFAGGAAIESPESDIRVHIHQATKQGVTVSFESALFPGTWVATPALPLDTTEIRTVAPLETTRDLSNRALFCISHSVNRQSIHEECQTSLHNIKQWLIPALQLANIPPEKSVILNALTHIDLHKWNLPLDSVLVLPRHLKNTRIFMETRLFLWGLEYLDVRPGQDLLQVNVSIGKIAQILCYLLRDSRDEFSFTGWDIDPTLHHWLKFIFRHRFSEAHKISVAVQNCFTFPAIYKGKFDRIMLCGKAPQTRYYQMCSLLKPGGILVGCFETLAGGRLFQVRKALDGTLSRVVITVFHGIQAAELPNLLAPPVISEMHDRVTHFHGDLDDEEELRQWLVYFGDAYNMNLSKYAPVILNSGYPLPLIREGGVSFEDLSQLGIPTADATGLAFAITKYSKFMEEKTEAAARETKRKVQHIDISVIRVHVDLLRVDAVLSEFEILLELTLHYHDYIQWRSLAAKKVFGTVEQPISVEELSIAPLLAFPNAKSPVTLISESACIVPQTGMVNHSFVFSGVFLEIMELQRFPFDRQVLHAEFKHDQKHQQNISISWKEPDTPNPDNFTLVSHDREWKEANVVSVAYPRGSDSKLVISGRVERYSSYFMWNVVFVMWLIVSMSFMTWALPPEEGGDRLSLNLTLLLTSVAYKYVIAGYLPRTAYLTILDLYVLSSFVLLVVVIVENAGAAMCSSPANRNLDKISAIVLVPVWLIINLIMTFGCIFGIFRLNWDVVDAEQIVISDKDRKRHKKFQGFLSRGVLHQSQDI
ncbi:Gamma-aminobutyric acid receptor subunit gamma-3 [Pelomyxa schiedti]|nr:Gamma-aminobutyric acid receptor subunit gamma-3 [Pelomyxa schiedti]